MKRPEEEALKQFKLASLANPFHYAPLYYMIYLKPRRYKKTILEKSLGKCSDPSMKAVIRSYSATTETEELIEHLIQV